MSNERTHRENEIREALVKKVATIQYKVAHQLFNAIRVNIGKYKSQVFWYVNKCTDSPYTPLQERIVAIGRGFPFRMQSQKRQLILEYCYPFLYHIILEDNKPKMLPFTSMSSLHFHRPLSSKPFKGWISGVDVRACMQPFYEKWTKNKILPFLRLASYETIPFDGAISTSLLAF